MSLNIGDKEFLQFLVKFVFARYLKISDKMSIPGSESVFLNEILSLSLLSFSLHPCKFIATNQLSVYRAKTLFFSKNKDSH